MKKITSCSTLCTIILVVLFSIQPLFSTEIIPNLPTDSSEDDLFACTGTVISTFPYTESFEGGLGNWTQPGGDDGDWLRDSGTTPSNNTGPWQASDGTFYYYTEASNGGAGSIGFNATVFLQSPCIDLTSETSAYFSFDYHMYGAGMGKGNIKEICD